MPNKIPKLFAKSKGKIFISYRRDDTASDVGRLLDRLDKQFGHKQIFRDVESIVGGDDFDKAINSFLSSCHVLIVMIGKRWLQGDEISSRLNNPDDYVRKEIAFALNRQISVIPVLVHGASLPPEKDLPIELKPLLKKQALEISEARWEFDVSRLINVVKQKLPPLALSWVRVTLLLSCLIVLIAGVVVLKGKLANQHNEPEKPNQVATDLDRSLHPLFPIKVECGFTENINDSLFNSYRQRLLKAVALGNEGVTPEMVPGNKLFPDPKREPMAYAIVTTEPQARIFCIRDTMNQLKTSFGKFDPDLSFPLSATFNLDGKISHGKGRAYSLFKTGFVFVSFPGSVINLSDCYSNGRVVSTVDLLSMQLILEISPFFELDGSYDRSTSKAITGGIDLDFLDIEFPGTREIRLQRKDFKFLEGSHRRYYVFMFPNSKEEVEKLYMP